MTFYAALFNIKKATLIYYSIQLMQDESNNDMTIFSDIEDFPTEKNSNELKIIKLMPLLHYYISAWWKEENSTVCNDISQHL